MKRSLLIITIAFSLAGCSMTPTQKRWTAIGVSVVATGLLIAHQQDKGAVVASEQTGKGGPFHPCPSGVATECK